MMNRPSGGNPPTADARLVTRTGTRTVYRRVARVDVDEEHGRETKILTCGHLPGSNKARKDGRFPCYECTVEKARRADG